MSLAQRAGNPVLTPGRLAMIVASRLLLNAIFRVTYPLAPFVVERFGVSVRAATWLVTIQVLAGLASPIGGWLSDRRGYRGTMLLGLGVSCLGAIGVAFAREFAVIIAALAAIGLGAAIYQPSMQAYVSELTPLARRGRALGIVELSWSLAGIIAVSPIIAVVIWSGELRLPFGLLALLILAMLVLTAIFLPPEQRHRAQHEAPSFRRVLSQPHLIGFLLFLWFAVCGQEVLFIAQVPWLTQRFGASPRAIGFAMFVFGLGELAGVFLVTGFADRIGRLRAPLLGFAGAALIYVLLPLLSQSWTSYLALFALFAVAFEFAIVSSFALASGLDPAARGTVMAGCTVATATGRAAGSRIGVPLIESTSIVFNGAVAALLTLAGVLIAIFLVRPQENDGSTIESEAVRLL